MEEKGRVDCPWSITVINGGGIAGGESGTFHHEEIYPQKTAVYKPKTTTGRAFPVLVVPTTEVLTGSDANDDTAWIKGLFYSPRLHGRLQTFRRKPLSSRF